MFAESRHTLFGPWVLLYKVAPSFFSSRILCQLRKSIPPWKGVRGMSRVSLATRDIPLTPFQGGIGLNACLQPLAALALIFISTPLLHATSDFVPTASARHAYIDAKVIYSFELTPKKEAFIEVLNLGDVRKCLSVENISMRTEDGKVLKFDSFLYDGSKSKTEGGDKACVRERTRRKWELGYSFEFPQKVYKVVFLVGNTAFRLQPLSQAEFEEFTRNRERINLGESSEYLKVFNLRVLFGKNIYGSSVRYRKVNIPSTTEGTRGPVTLLSTFPKQTEQAFKKKKGGEVPIKVKLDSKGEVIEATAEAVLEYGLTERAVYEVKNWWEFAPAFENGKPVPSEHTVKVVYRIEEEEEE
jgi:Gram-negative bacterial TonB protein C-terminal